MHAEFEEKTFEQLLTSELVNGRSLFFPPGQVLEEIVGFDVALRTSNRSLWRLFPHMYPWWCNMLSLSPPGISPRHAWWQELERGVEQFPKFKFNCFIQAKRPNYMVRSDAAEYSSWNKPYFRFDTYAHQQKALESLALRTTGKAVVVYACPAFCTYRALWAAVSASHVVTQTNFCEAERLKGHARYSYVAAGNKGFAHSDPTPVESMPFEQALAQIANQVPAQSNLVFLASTATVIHAAAENLGPLFETYLSIVNGIFPDVDSKLAQDLARIYAFQFVCSVKLLIGYEG